MCQWGFLSFRFKTLESSGGGILEEEQLEDALKNASLADDEELSPEMLR